MVLNDGSQYIKGNTVEAPERYEQSPIKKEKYKELRRAQIERENRLKHKKNLEKRKALKTIVAIFVVGFAIMMNEGQIYSKQQKLSSINDQIEEVNKNSEDLRIRLVSLNGLEKIQEMADTKLHMVAPQRDKIVYINFTKSNFTEIPSEEESRSEGFLARIKSLLY